MSANRREARQMRPRRVAATLTRLLLIAACGIPLIWASISVGAANKLRGGAPATALRFAPYDARAKAELAQAQIVELAQRPGDPSAAEALLRESVTRDPTNAAAWRSLGLVAQFRRDTSKTVGLFHFAERLSRRDLPTQLWLIEERVAANDIRGALRHYDIALRTSSGASQLLLPILVSATAENSIVEPLAELMATNPPWGGDLLARLAESAPSSEHLAAFMEKLARSRRLPQSLYISAMINRLIEARDFQNAWRIQRLIRPPGPAERFVRNGQFDILEPASGFDWLFENDDTLGAEPIMLDGAGQGASLQVHGDRPGIVARQLLLLPPGQYRVAAAAGPVDGTAPASIYWSVACADAGQTQATEGQPATVHGPSTLQLAFHVPASHCTAQWLSIGIRPQGDAGSVSAWIDGVTVQPVGTGTPSS